MTKEFDPVCGTELESQDQISIYIDAEQTTVLTGLDASSENDEMVVLNLGNDPLVLLKLYAYIKHLLQGPEHHGLSDEDIKDLLKATITTDMPVNHLH